MTHTVYLGKGEKSEYVHNQSTISMIAITYLGFVPRKIDELTRSWKQGFARSTESTGEVDRHHLVWIVGGWMFAHSRIVGRVHLIKPSPCNWNRVCGGKK